MGWAATAGRGGGRRRPGELHSDPTIGGLAGADSGRVGESARDAHKNRARERRTSKLGDRGMVVLQFASMCEVSPRGDSSEVRG